MRTKTVDVDYAYMEDDNEGDSFDYITFKVHKSEKEDMTRIKSVIVEVPEKKIEITESELDRIKEDFTSGKGVGLCYTDYVKQRLGF